MAGQLPDPGRGGCGWAAIQAAAAAAGREIEPDHYGISLAVTDDASRPALLEAARRRRPDVDPERLIASGWAWRARHDRGLRGTPALPSSSSGPAGRRLTRTWFTADFAREMVPLQT